jgi:galactokinase/galacturonokinase
LSADEWQAFAPQLPVDLRRRADHFFAESERVLVGARAWERSDQVAFGEMMQASGMSSIHNYETGSPEMIRLYEVLNECRGVHGARFSGAGFRGCAVALIEPDRAADIAEEVESRYLTDFPHFADHMWAFASSACDGLALQ